MTRALPPDDITPLVTFRGVGKVYEGSQTAAVEALDLDIIKGEFLTLLGPSGSGKTTTLMMLAGFEAPDRGIIALKGKSLSGLPPHRRNMGVVFQNYALFPHMTVAENLAFPLKVRGVRAPEVAVKVRTALEMVGLGDLGARKPDALSGGQRQRVALARALIFEPDIVLMDEPLGALDRQLRERLQIEIKRIQRQLRVTVLYVTHDQDEALTLSDRIAVFADGRVQQIGTPEEVYERPANAFVAGFVGENNSLNGIVTARDGERCAVRIAGGQTIQAIAIGDIAPDETVVMTVRPEHVTAGMALNKPCNRIDARIEELVYHGDHTRIRAAVPGGGSLVIRAPSTVPLAPADPLALEWCADRCFAFAAPAVTSSRGAFA